MQITVHFAMASVPHVPRPPVYVPMCMHCHLVCTCIVHTALKTAQSGQNRTSWTACYSPCAFDPQKHKPVLYMYMCLLCAQLWISFHFHKGNNSNDRERSMHLLRVFCCVTLNVCSCAHSVEFGEPVRVLRGRERRNSKDECFSVLI